MSEKLHWTAIFNLMQIKGLCNRLRRFPSSFLSRDPAHSQCWDGSETQPQPVTPSHSVPGRVLPELTSRGPHPDTAPGTLSPAGPPGTGHTAPVPSPGWAATLSRPERRSESPTGLAKAGHPRYSLPMAAPAEQQRAAAAEQGHVRLRARPPPSASCHAPRPPPRMRRAPAAQPSAYNSHRALRSEWMTTSMAARGLLGVVVLRVPPSWCDMGLATVSGCVEERDF